MNVNMKISSGVVGLLANAHSTSSFRGKRYFFKGDLCQMSAAQKVAPSGGLESGIAGGLPFVMSQEDFDCVKKYLISNKVEGWWHYVTHEEYCEIKGEYHFGVKYLRYQKEIQQIADDLGIWIQKDNNSLLFVTSKKDFNAIVEKLNIENN